MHPILFLSSGSYHAEERLSQIREGIQSGHAKTLWEGVKAEADNELSSDLITTATALPDRLADQVEMKNLDWTITNALEKRIARHALAFHLTHDERYRDNALSQLKIMFDTDAFPAWCDMAAYKDGKPTVHLRTGAMAKVVGIAYDWLKDSLSPGERSEIIEGLDRRAIQPYLADIKENDPWWAKTDNNWCTCIVGGLAIAAMALKKEHSQTKELIDLAIPRFQNHIDSLGSEGEFNEGVGYAGAMILGTDYFTAYASYTEGERQCLSEHPFPQNALWYLYMTVPPGHLVAFGDAKARAPLKGNWVATIAHAAQDGILQWYYHHYQTPTPDPFDLLYYDANLEAIDPEGVLPRGRAYHDHGACISSRSSWDSQSPISVVMSKARREDNHEHNDVGQVCIDGYGRELIVDLGVYGGYPVGFFTRDRFRYYDTQAWGHNVPVFGGREMAFNYILDPNHTEGKLHNKRAANAQGEITRSEFSDDLGSIWSIDTTAAYEGVVQSIRTVIHLFPGIVIVLDEAKLEKSESISIRWHTVDMAAPASDGSFSVNNSPATLSAKIVTLDDNELSFGQGDHKYEAPWDRNQYGPKMLEQENNFIEAKLDNSDHCRVLSLFSINKESVEIPKWNREDNIISIETDSGKVLVSIHPDKITVGIESTAEIWSAPFTT
jgi:hypothetical protein